MLQVPRSVDEILVTLGTFGAAISLGKLLRSKEPLSWRSVLGRAMEGAGLAMCAGVILTLPKLFPTVFGSLQDLPPFALLGIGGLLASFGVSGLIGLARALRGGK